MVVQLGGEQLSVDVRLGGGQLQVHSQVLVVFWRRGGGGVVEPKAELLSKSCIAASADDMAFVNFAVFESIVDLRG